MPSPYLVADDEDADVLVRFDDAVVYTRRDGVWEDMFSGNKYISENGRMLIGKTEYTSKLLVHVEN